MLGVQWATVSGVASDLQEAGVILYRRGKIEILDLARLKNASSRVLLDGR